MSKILAIDLGTCNSAIAVAENLSGDSFYSLPELPGYSVILDKFRRRITPSVVAEDDRGEIVIGHAAKARAGRSPEPIMFAKRSMGEDVKFQLARQGCLTPVEVSAHILRYLKNLAKEQLGEEINRAVITVPAYFALKAKQMTEKAAEMAGLEVVRILPEPVAAALMYCASDPRESLRVMTYDLGGGTFDVAILEKIRGKITIDSILAFDGDRFLGGYEFDRAIAFWMFEQLKKKGLNLEMNPDHAKDRVFFAKMLIYAERAKIELSKTEVVEIIEPETGFTDRAGVPVAIELSLSRSEFEKMIAHHVSRTIDLCHAALISAERAASADSSHREDGTGKASGEMIASLDEILMVGGSSRIPCIGKALEKEFGRLPKLVEPDLCVALGAAVFAASEKKAVLGKFFELDSLPPTVSPMPTIQITGKIVGAATGSTLQVQLRSLDGGFSKAVDLTEDRRFALPGIPLNRASTTDFVLELRAGDGSVLDSHRFSVKHVNQLVEAAAPANTVVVSGTRTNFLAKPIVVVWKEGPEVIAPVRTPLPFRCQVTAQTADNSGRIRLIIREGNTPLGELIMSDVPETLTIGSEVEFSIDITQSYQIHARAYVKSLAKAETVTIDLPPRPVRTLDELRGDFDSLEARADDARRSAGAGALFGGGRSQRLKERLTACEKMLNGPAPEAPAIQDCMDEIEGLLSEMTATWNPDPTRDKFDLRVKQAWDLHGVLTREKPETEAEGFDRQIEATVADAEGAFQRQEAVRWKQGWERLNKLMDKMRDRITPPPPKVTPPQLKMMCHAELNDLEAWARDNGFHAVYEGEFVERRKNLEKIDVSVPDAFNQLFDWYEKEFLPLKAKLAKLADGIPEGGGLVSRGTLNR